MAVSIENSHVPSLNLNNCNIEILVGTYEDFILGYKLTTNSEGGLKFTPSFTNHSHCGSIRAVAASRRFLASGSSDECIRLFCLKTRGEHGFLQHHNGTITCLEFFKQTHLFSGSEDGKVCIWNTRTWNCEKTLKAHEGGVTAMSVHPSGKLALTVGKDRAMKTWNLIKGRTAYVTNIKAVATAVMWAPDGNTYAVATNKTVNIYEVKSAGIVYTVEFKYPVNFITFLNEDTLVVGGVGPEVEVHSIKEGKLLTRFKAHAKSVRVASVVTVDKLPLLVTAANDRFIRLWQVPTDGSEPTVLAETDTSCRIISLAIWATKVLPNGVNIKSDETETVKEATSSSADQSQVDTSKTAEQPDEDTAPAVKTDSAESTSSGTAQAPPKILKRARQPGEDGISIIKTSSGEFIAEPIVKRKNNRKLSFAADV